MSLGTIDVAGSLSFDPEEVLEIERGNLLPEGQRVLKVTEVTLKPCEAKRCGIDFGADDGLLECIVTMQADAVYDEEGNSKQHRERYWFLHPSVDVDSFNNQKLTQMHSISTRSILNLVKVSQIPVPFDEETGKQDFAAALTEGLVGIRYTAVCKHDEAFANLSKIKLFEEE